MSSFVNIQVRVLAARAMREIDQLRLRMGMIEQTMTRTSRSTSQFGSILNGVALDRFGSRVQWVGRQLEYNFTIPIVMAGAAATKWALENEAAFTRVEKVYGDATHDTGQFARELGVLDEAFVALSNRYGVHQKEVIGIAAAWAAAGSSGVDLAESVDLTMKTMILGEIGAAQATEALIAIQAQYSMSTKEMVKVIATLNMVENQSGASLLDLIQGFSRAAGVARAAGVDVRHLAAYMAALVPATGTATAAGNALKTIFSRLLSPTEEMVEVLGLMGIQYDSLRWKSATVVQQLDILSDSFENLSDKQQGVVSSVIASRWQVNKFEVLMRELSDAGIRYGEALRVTASDTLIFSQMTKELNAVLDSSPRRLQIIWTMLQNAAADGVQPLIPLILHLAEAVKEMVTWFTNLHPATQKLILAFLLLLAAIGPVVRIFGALILLLSYVQRIIIALILPFKLLAVAMYSLIKVPIIAFFTRLSNIARWTAAMLAPVFASGLAALKATMYVGGAAVVMAWRAVSIIMVTSTQVLAMSVVAIWKIFLNALFILTASWHTRILAIAIPFAKGMQTIYTAMSRGIIWIVRTMYATIATMSILFAGVFQASVIAMARFVGVAWRGILAATTIFRGGFQAAIIGMAMIAGRTWRAMYAMLLSLTKIFTVAFQGALMILARGAGVIWRSMYVMLANVSIVFGKGLQVIAIAMATGLGKIWRIMYAGLLAMTVNFKAHLLKLWGLIVRGVAIASNAAAAAATGPWGVAIALVIALVIAFWDELKAVWNALVRGTVAAFNALPEGIQNAMMAVVKTVRAAVLAVYEWFSYLNPWARHSPSLVENVTTGVAEIISQYSRLDRITDVFAKAGVTLEEFARATKRVRAAAEARELADFRKELKAIAPDAVASFDKLVKLLNPLRDLLAEIKLEVIAQQSVVDSWKVSLDAANAALDEQQAILDGLESVANGYKDQLEAAQAQLDKFVNAPIEGMKAFEDAIFVSQMRQKELRLELMRMEDAVGPLDELRGRLQSIQGAMELVSGEQNQMRNAGAGSDILSQYDDQISALEQQQNAIKAQVAPLEDLTHQIEQLGREADMLDLEKSLAFDPLKRQIDDLINSMEEMPFDEILAGVIANQAEVDRLTEAYNSANAAVQDQTAIVNQLKAARDAIQASYDAEVAKLNLIKDEYSAVEEKIREIEQALRDVSSAAQTANGSMSPGASNFLASAGGNFPDVGGTGDIGRTDFRDQTAEIEAFTKQLSEDTANMFGAFDFLDPIKKAWNTAVAWLKENIGPGISAFGTAFSDAMSGIPNPFAGLSFDSVLSTVKNFWDSITGFAEHAWELIGPPIMEIKKVLEDAFNRAMKEIGPELGKFKDLLEPAQKALGNIWAVLKPVAAIIGGVLLFVINQLVNILKNTLGPVLNWIIDVIKGVIKIFRGLIEFVIGVFTGDWKMAWQGIKDFFVGIWDIVWSTLKNAFLLISGIVEGFVEGIVSFFTWLWDELVGHSIIPDIVDGIVYWFNLMRDLVLKVVDLVSKGIKWAWENLIKPVFDAWGVAVNLLKTVFNTVWGWIKSAWDGMVDKVLWAWDKLKYYFNLIKDIFSGLGNKWVEIVNGVKTYIDKVVGWFNDIKNRFSFTGLFDGLKTAFKSAVNYIINKWNSMSFGVGPFSADTPNIPLLAKGGVVNRATAIVGEGRRGYPEYVIPTDPMYRGNALSLFNELSAMLGVQDVLQSATMRNAMSNAGSFGMNRNMRFFQRGGFIGGFKKSARSNGSSRGAQYNASATTKNFNFYGNLEFPNVKDGDDAEEFLKNLEALINEG